MNSSKILDTKLERMLERLEKKKKKTQKTKLKNKK